MPKTSPAKKTSGAVQAKPKVATAVDKVAAAPKPAMPAKPAVAKVKPAAAKAKPAGKTAAAPKPAKPAAAALKASATGLNGHGGADAKAKSEKQLAAPQPKVKKPKLVRDSFTMPELEYQVLGDVKKACLKAGIEVKKSELLRVGVALIKQLDMSKLKAALTALPPLKVGRPKNEK